MNQEWLIELIKKHNIYLTDNSNREASRANLSNLNLDGMKI